jgi:hypothetical protein
MAVTVLCVLLVIGALATGIVHGHEAGHWARVVRGRLLRRRRWRQLLRGQRRGRRRGLRDDLLSGSSASSGHPKGHARHLPHHATRNSRSIGTSSPGRGRRVSTAQLLLPALPLQPLLSSAELFLGSAPHLHVILPDLVDYLRVELGGAISISSIIFIEGTKAWGLRTRLARNDDRVLVVVGQEGSSWRGLSGSWPRSRLALISPSPRSRASQVTSSKVGSTLAASRTRSSEFAATKIRSSKVSTTASGSIEVTPGSVEIASGSVKVATSWSIEFSSGSIKVATWSIRVATWSIKVAESVAVAIGAVKARVLKGPIRREAGPVEEAPPSGWRQASRQGQTCPLGAAEAHPGQEATLLRQRTRTGPDERRRTRDTRLLLQLVERPRHH